MDLNLTDTEANTLAAELDAITRNDRYPLSPRIQTLKSILGKLRPEPARPPIRHQNATSRPALSGDGGSVPR
jgi:hypothetical protein